MLQSKSQQEFSKCRCAYLRMELYLSEYGNNVFGRLCRSNNSRVNSLTIWKGDIMKCLFSFLLPISSLFLSKSAIFQLQSFLKQVAFCVLFYHCPITLKHLSPLLNHAALFQFALAKAYVFFISLAHLLNSLHLRNTFLFTSLEYNKRNYGYLLGMQKLWLHFPAQVHFPATLICRDPGMLCER